MKIRDILRILRTPACWQRTHGTSRTLSDYINACLDAGMKPKRANLHNISLGGIMLWSSNYPYSYGNIDGLGNCGLPDRTTVFRLADAVAAYCPLPDKPTSEAKVRAAIEKASAANDDHTPPPDMAA